MIARLGRPWGGPARRLHRLDVGRLSMDVKERRNLVVAPVLFLVLVGVIPYYVGVVYGWGAEGGEGAARTIGEVIGTFLMGGLVVAVLFSKTRFRNFRLSITLALTIIVFASRNTETFLRALDVKEAKPLLASSVSLDDYLKNAREHPNNRLLGFMAEVMQTIIDLQEKDFATINDSIAPQGIADTPTLDQMNLEQLNAFANSLYQAEQNALGAPSKADSIFANTRLKLSSLAKKYFTSNSMAKNTLEGFDKSAPKTRDLLVKSYSAQQAALHSLRVVVVFLSSHYGHYKMEAGVYRFVDQPTADAFNAIVNQFRSHQASADTASNDVYESGKAAGEKMRLGFQQ
jgi:hypothetical protein